MYVCVPNVYLAAHGGQKRAMDPLELELLVTSCVHTCWEPHCPLQEQQVLLFLHWAFSLSSLPFSVFPNVSLSTESTKRYTRLCTTKGRGQKITCHQFSFNAKLVKNGLLLCAIPPSPLIKGSSDLQRVSHLRNFPPFLSSLLTAHLWHYTKT